MKKLIEIIRCLVIIFVLWCTLSFAASIIQVLEVQDGRAKCETQTYIEYVLFTDLFCEVQK